MVDIIQVIVHTGHFDHTKQVDRKLAIVRTEHFDHNKVNLVGLVRPVVVLHIVMQVELRIVKLVEQHNWLMSQH